MQCRGFLENGSFLVAIYLEIVINSHFRGAIGTFRLAICGVLHKFSTVIFANLLKIMDFSKVGAKKGVPCCKHSPHRPTLAGNCHGSTLRNMYEFFMWQLPPRCAHLLQLAFVMVAVECAISDYHMVHEEQAHHLARLSHLHSQPIVILRWHDATTWMVVGYCHDGGVALHGFFWVTCKSVWIRHRF